MTRALKVRALIALVAVTFSVLASVPATLALEVNLDVQDAGATFQATGTDSVVAEIAYRSTTGSSGTSAPKNRTLDGTSWTAATEQATAGSSIRAVRMAWSPVKADERIFVTQSSDGWLDAYVCNPTCNVTNDIGQVWSTAPGTPERRFDVAYEQVGGGALLVYGVESTDPTQDIAYRTYSGGGWSTEQYLDDPVETSDVQYTLIILAWKGGSDQVGLLGADGTNDDVNAWIWDGGAFGSFVEINASAEHPDEYQAAIAWESGSGNLVAVSVDAGTADCRYKEFTSDWSVDTTITCGNTSPIRWLSLKPNPLSTAHDMVLTVGDAGADLSTVYWDGTAWGALVSQDTGMDYTTSRSFDFAWEATGSKGVLVWGTRSGQITYSAFTAPSTWGTATDAAMGTNTHRWVLLRTNTAPVQGGPKILGAVLENGANDLGAISWDGTNLTVAGASVFTANTGASTYESFDLEPRAAGGGFTLNLFGGQTLNLFGFQIGLTTFIALVAGVVALVFVLVWRRSRRRREPSYHKSKSSSRSVGDQAEPEGEIEGEIEGEVDDERDNEPEGEPEVEPEDEIEDEVEASSSPSRGRTRH